ncbi:MAG TPA: ribbon-helix-helix protein, CopG family [Archaeoglobus sp.]|nr:ribbon-helix-helix protein, CopG family [Archaeoglobus sp.]
MALLSSSKSRATWSIGLSMYKISTRLYNSFAQGRFSRELKFFYTIKTWKLMGIVAFRLDDKIIKKIDEIAGKTLMTRSEVIRNALTVYLMLLENIGFYFKPSFPLKNIDVYEERNAVNIDLGNLMSISVFTISYGGVGEKKLDFRRNLEFVAEVMANQLIVESICRFISPIIVLVSTANDFEYSKKFFQSLDSALNKHFKVKLILASTEDLFRTEQSGFSCTLVGIRDLSVKNIPKRGERIFFYGRSVNTSDLKIDDLLNVDKLRELAELVRGGMASSIFPVKSMGLVETAQYVASLAGGRAVIKCQKSGGPGTAVILTSSKELEGFGCEEVGEII